MYKPSVGYIVYREKKTGSVFIFLKTFDTFSYTRIPFFLRKIMPETLVVWKLCGVAEIISFRLLKRLLST